QVMGDHRRFHARATHFVDGGGADRVRQSGAPGSLAGRGLTLASGQHAPHQYLVDLRGLQGRARKRATDRVGAEIHGAKGREFAKEAAHGVRTAATMTTESTAGMGTEEDMLTLGSD